MKLKTPPPPRAGRPRLKIAADLAELKVNQSIEIGSYTKRRYHSAASASKNYGKRLGRKFTIRTIEDLIFIYRVS